MENVIKGWFSTLLGAALMVLALIEWWTSETKKFYEPDVLIPLIAGFALFQMRDKISDWVNQFVSIALDKFKEVTNLFQKK